MRRIANILLLTCMSPFSLAFSQAKVHVTCHDVPLSVVIADIEKQSGCKIYRNPFETDSITASLRVDGADPAEALRKALEGTPLKLSSYGGCFFISSNSHLVTTLPDGFFFKSDTLKGEAEGLVGVELMAGRRNRKATSENRVYEIGDSNAESKPKVTLTGNITDFKSGEPMVGVAVFVKEPMVGTTTDAYGYYTLMLPPGRHELNIQGIGMKDSRRQIVIHSDGKLDIELEEQVYALKEVTISSEKIANVRNTSLGVERLKVKDIKNIPTAFGEVDIMRVVMSLPGVKSVGEASSGFNVRGGATDQNLILFNDGTVYNPTHLFGFFSVFNPDVVKDMELYKSSIPAKYGGRISSVLDINGREGNKKELKGSASLGLLTSRVTLEGPLFSEKTSFIVAGRTTYSDWILKKLPEKSGYKDGNAGFYDLNASINHRFDERNNLYLNGYYSHDRFRFDTNQRYAYQNANGSVKWRRIFSDRLTGVFTAGYDHYSYTTRDTENQAEAYDLSFRIDQGYGKFDFTHYLNDKHTLDFGLSSIYYNLQPGEYKPYGGESLVLEDVMQREKALETAIYLGDRWDITPRLSVNAGIRYSLFNVIGPRLYNTYDESQLPSLGSVTGHVEKSGLVKTYHGPEVRLSARYSFDNDFSVKAGFNMMRQNIHKLSNTTIMSPTDTWKLSDMNIKPQTGMQVAAGLYKNFMNNLIEVSLEGYYKKMKDYLDYRNGAELMMNHHIETDVLRTEGQAYGVELMVKKSSGKLNGWVSYTYSRTKLRQNDPMILNPVNNGDWYPADFDKPHDLKFVGNFRFTHRFSFSLNCDYSTGRPITLPVSKYHYGGGEFVYYSDRNRYRIPDFFRMDASFNIEPSHHLTLLTHSSISIGVYNLTGRKNAYSVYYISEGGKLKGYRMAIFGMPIPFISYNIKF